LINETAEEETDEGGRVCTVEGVRDEDGGEEG
jgi:hypothetical protein